MSEASLEERMFGEEGSSSERAILTGARPAHATDDAVSNAVTEARRAPIDFRTLFELEADYVARTLKRLGVRSSDVEDATHEVFVAVHSRLGEYDPSRPIRPWLFAFAYRVACAEKRRRHHRFDLRDEVPDVADEASDVHAAAERNERRSVLLSALASLSPEQRAVVVMHELDGLLVPEIAEALEIPLNTAYSRLRLGREELVRHLHRMRTRMERSK